MVGFIMFVICSCFAFIFVGACWVFILLGCLLEFLKCIVTFHFVDMPERLQNRAAELKTWGYDLSQMCAECFSDSSEDEPPCYE